MVPYDRLLSEHDLDAESLKKAFDVRTLHKREKVQAFVFRVRDSIKDGLERNRRDYRLFKSMDWAMDSPFYQISYTQLRGLLNSSPDEKKVMETVNSWGLTHLLPTIMKDGKPVMGVDGKPSKSLNLPFLTNVFIPICMAYHTVRLAKLFNDRNLNPLYKYEPVQLSKENRLRCEVVTQIVQKQAAWFDYKSDLRQSISQMLQYGFCINFPREAWFVEKQEDENGKEVITREGLRFDMPHPSRTYFDKYHRLSSLNSNSGCRYVGNWVLVPYRDIKNNKHYWNKDRIGIGAHGWLDIGNSKSDFLAQVYPCTMKFPDPVGGNDPGGVGGAGALSREDDAAFYGEGHDGAATLKTEHFERIIPAEEGLGDYEYPVWMRLVFASDNAVIWAEPLSFDRFPAYCYDADFNRSRFRSLVLETMPFQDQIGNLLSQWGVAVRENLRNPIFVDLEKLPANALSALENWGEKMYGGRQYIGFKSTLNFRFGREDQKEAFFTPQLTRHDTGQIHQLILGQMDMLDRVMQLSPQEIGQSASHEQTAEETRLIAGNMSTRVAFTGSFIDDADYAKKVMLYQATMAHADDGITVGVSSAFASTEDEFKKLVKTVGLTIDDDTTYDPTNPAAIRNVKVKKSAIVLEAFASTREAASRVDNPAIADAMSKIFIAVANNQILIQAIGAIQLVELLNQIIIATGLPKEFRLKGQAIDPNAAPEAQSEQLTQMLTQLSEQVQKNIEGSQVQTMEAAGKQTEVMIGKAMEALVQQVAPMGEALKQQQIQIDQVKQAVGQLAQAIAGAMPQPPPAQI